MLRGRPLLGEYEPERFKDAMLMVREFCQITTERQCSVFKKSYGPIYRNGNNIKNADILRYAKHLAVAAKNFDEAWLLMPSDERRKLLLRQIKAEFNVAPVTIHKGCLQLNEDEQHALKMRSDNLLATMWLTFAVMVQENTNTQKCNYCGEWFVSKEISCISNRNAFCCEDHQILFHSL